ncbi:hypothetical protein Pmani_030447 [Petrolisthes manimaculis]|uniref:Uncharacterized protein n=1 Tax=Petrolisthes manimaculis TaxID=1843537 RepID=A0AAE1NX89_9EUCA|nr:hypothetical protein Pmani_030447 [Petrolisthes manimaculis]
MTTIGYRFKKRGRLNRTRPLNARDDDNNNNNNNRGMLPLNITKGDLNAYFNNRFNNPNHATHHNPYAWSGPGPPSSVYTVEKARPNFGPPHRRDWKAYDKFLQEKLG